MKLRFFPSTATAASAPAKYPGLDLLAAAILMLRSDGRVTYVNPAAENLFELSRNKFLGHTPEELFGECPGLRGAIAKAVVSGASYTEQEIEMGVAGRNRLHLTCTVSSIDAGEAALLVELRHIDQQLKIAREERLREQQQANRELIRNLAHEIKNPLGGIRGSAQLLERELANPQLHEYTQVIIKEADRLQELMNRLLSSHRLMQPQPVNIHDILDRVRALILAEFPDIGVKRDYDISLPDATGDREQLIQAILNIVRNAAQALEGRGEIVLRTRVLRQVTLAKRRYRLALELQVIDNGPGIPEAIREQMFYPLVSGREGGSGLGLTLAQNFIQQHHGSIEVDSRPGRTCFTVLLPLHTSNQESQ